MSVDTPPDKPSVPNDPNSDRDAPFVELVWGSSCDGTAIAARSGGRARTTGGCCGKRGGQGRGRQGSGASKVLLC